MGPSSMISGVILDLDGTVYLGEEQVPGAGAFIEFVRDAGGRCLFVTNRANRSPEEVCCHLQGYGIACAPSDVLTSAQATAAALAPGRVYVVGEPPLEHALAAAGFEIADDTVDYVVVGFDRGFTYAKLKTACALIRRGAAFVATNPDKGLHTAAGIDPGTGSILAAIVAGAEEQPTVIGKPERLIMDLAVTRLAADRDAVIAVGDNLETDILAGVRAGLRTALILTGVSHRRDVAQAPCQPTWVVDDYAALRRVVAEENRKGGNAS